MLGENSKVGLSFGKKLKKMHKRVWKEIKDITPLIRDANGFPFVPAAYIERIMEAGAAEKVLQAVQKSFCEENLRNMGARVVGLAVRHSGQPAFRAAVKYAKEDTKWMIFSILEGGEGVGCGRWK
jgi:hypothetical protein